MISRFRLLFTLLLCFVYNTTINSVNDSPTTEIRAVWLTTNWKLDWPQKGKSVEEQKKELTDILDQLSVYNINLVLFQVRAQGKAIYNSKIMSKSPYYNSSNSFDPLTFAIEECHKRQMECHAWMTTFPVEKVNKQNRTKPSYYTKVNGYWYLDPARPETKNLLNSIVAELVDNYDIDGIHLDYIRYPDNKKWINDSDSYKKYGNKRPIDEWRRENVNQVVTQIYDLVKSKKNWVQVSSSPIGKFERIHNNDGWTAYDDVFQDPISWTDSNKHDILFPMMYYPLADFKRHYDHWVKQAKGRYIVPGIGLYKTTDKVNPVSTSDIVDELQYLKDKQSVGVAFFRTEQVISGEKQIKESIENLYAYPAKLPPLYWLDDNKNENKPNIEAHINKGGNLELIWTDDKKDDRMTYNVYASTNKSIDFSQPKELLIANFRGDKLEIDYDKGEFAMYYFVTSSNRYHTESTPSEPVYFYHSNNLFK